MYYDVLTVKYGDDVELCYTYTDSFVIKIITGGIHKDLKQLNTRMDFSSYDKANSNYTDKIKSCWGNLKMNLMEA